MKTSIRVLAAFLIILVVSGCKNSVDQRFNQWEVDVEENPEKVMTELKNIDKSTLSEEELARYAILYTQAQDKNDIECDNDSLISIAYNYYETRPDKRHRMLANYYYAVVQYNARNYGEALACALESLDTCKDIDDNYNKARILSLITYIYAKSSNNQTALDFNILEHQTALQINQPLWIKNSTLTLIDRNISLRNLDRAEAILDSISQLPEYTNEDIYNRVVSLYTLKGDYNYVRHFVDSIGILANASYESLAAIAIAEKIGGDHIIAEKLKNDLLQNTRTQQDTIEALYMQMYFALDDKDYKKAYEYQDNLFEKEDSILLELSNHSIHLYQIQWEKNKNARLLQQKKEDRLQLGIAGLSIILISIFGAIIIIYLKKKISRERIQHEKKIETIISETKSAKIALLASEKEQMNNIQTINALDKENLELRKEALQLFVGQFDWIDKLGEIYTYSSIQGQNSYKTAYKKIITSLNEVAGSDFQNKLEVIINKHRNNIISRIKESCPKVTQSEISLLIYICAGLSVPTIELLLKKNSNAIYNLKHRLKGKITTYAPALLKEMADLF